MNGRRLVRWIWTTLPWLVAGGGVVALALHGSLRDSVPYVAGIHYGTPLPVIAVVAAFGGALGVVREQVVPAALCALLVAVSVATHRAEAFRTGAGQTPPGPDAVRVVLWNVQREWRRPQRVIDEALAMDADVLVFVEPLRTEDRDTVLDVRPRLPGYDVADLTTKFVVAVRGTIVHAGDVQRRRDASIAEVDVEVDGRPLSLVCVDVGSNPWTPREPSLRAIARVAAPVSERAALLLGDFNTPRRSRHMDLLRARWFHAWETAGRGFDLTWPEPAPVLSIDHVFASRSVRTMSCRIPRTRVSDHRPVIVDIE